MPAISDADVAQSHTGIIHDSGFALIESKIYLAHVCLFRCGSFNRRGGLKKNPNMLHTPHYERNGTPILGNPFYDSLCQSSGP